jgi:hypothetical protein
MGRSSWRDGEQASKTVAATMSRIPGGFLVLALAAAACAPVAAPPILADVPATLAPTDVPAQRADTQTAPRILAPSNPTATIVVGPGGQFATDPSTVDLASGRPTLVKFFAFW